MNLNRAWLLIRKTVLAWIDDYAPSMGAAISYYTIFSIAPVLVIVVAVAGLIWGQEAVQGEISGQLTGLVGTQAAQAIQSMLQAAHHPTQGLVAGSISVVALIIGATTVFAELQSSLDRIWRVPAAEKASGLWATVRTRLLSFGIVLALAFLLSTSLVASAAVSALGNWANGLLPAWQIWIEVLNVVVSIGLSSVLFAAIFKLMPNAPRRLGGCLDRRGRHGRAVSNRQGVDLGLHRHCGHRVCIRCCRLARGIAALGLLRRTDLFVGR